LINKKHLGKALMENGNKANGWLKFGATALPLLLSVVTWFQARRLAKRLSGTPAGPPNAAASVKPSSPLTPPPPG
jgi:hypothetical protein